MIDFLVNNHTRLFRMSYIDYRKLLESANCDVFNLLNKYGIELFGDNEDQIHAILIVTDSTLFLDFLKNENYPLFPS